jgi:hypothetical protein
MASNYKYKDYNISDIVKFFNTNDVLSKFSGSGFTTGTTDMNTSLVNVNTFSTDGTLLNYMTNSTDISTYAIPLYSEYTSSSTVTIPAWCKKVRVIMIGGGGGGYAGDNAYYQIQHVHTNFVKTQNNNDDVDMTIGYGGYGGGSGGFLYFNNYAVTSGSSSYQIQVGGGGGGGEPRDRSAGPSFQFQGGSRNFQGYDNGNTGDGALLGGGYNPQAGGGTTFVDNGTQVAVATGGAGGSYVASGGTAQNTNTTNQNSFTTKTTDRTDNRSATTGAVNGTYNNIIGGSDGGRLIFNYNYSDATGSYLGSYSSNSNINGQYGRGGGGGGPAAPTSGRVRGNYGGAGTGGYARIYFLVN